MLENLTITAILFASIAFLGGHIRKMSRKKPVAANGASCGGGCGSCGTPAAVSTEKPLRMYSP
jgi:hypothetical protein